MMESKIELNALLRLAGNFEKSAREDDPTLPAGWIPPTSNPEIEIPVEERDMSNFDTNIHFIVNSLAGMVTTSQKLRHKLTGISEEDFKKDKSIIRDQLRVLNSELTHIRNAFVAMPR